MSKLRMSNRGQRGMTMIEVTMALALSAIVTTVYQAQQIISVAEDLVAQGVGTHVLQVQAGATKYTQMKFVELTNNSSISGVANILEPTIAELKALGYVASTVRSVTSTGQDIKVSLTRTGCPGLGCSVNGLVYVNGPLIVGRTGNTPRIDLASVAVTAMKGAGGLSYFDNPGQIRSPSGTYPNPLGTTVGVVGALTFVDTAFYNQFVRINDSRDPNLAGNLSVAGNTALAGTLSVAGLFTASAGATLNGNTNVNGNLKATGNVSVNDGACDRASILMGRIVVRNGACAVTGALDAAGRLELGDGAVNRIGLDGVNGTLTISDGSNVQVLLSRTGGGGLIEAKNLGGGTTASIDGATGVISGARASLTATGTEGAACGPGVLAGDFVKDANSAGTLLMCRGGVWVSPGLQRGAVGQACGSATKLAQAADGTALVCRGGTFVNLNDRVSRQIAVDRRLVVDGDVVAHPVCGVGGDPDLLLTPFEAIADYSGAPPRNRFFGRSINVGSSWVVTLRLVDGTGTEFTTDFAGVPYGLRAIATSSCVYPAGT